MKVKPMIPEKIFAFSIIWILAAVAVFFSLMLLPAPYGRHVRNGWGPFLPDRWGWLLMESPAATGMLIIFLARLDRQNSVTLFFLILWQAHYFHRAFIYPFHIKKSRKQMPLSIAFFAFTFNIINVSLNGWMIFSMLSYPPQWFWDIRFIGGVLLFGSGFVINRHSDHILRRLKHAQNNGYSVPSGGLFNLVSCPNYLGEIIEWTGWALATWSWAGLSFALWTIANLSPRAHSHHHWYHTEFQDYPENRKALLPWIW